MSDIVDNRPVTLDGQAAPDGHATLGDQDSAVAVLVLQFLRGDDYFAAQEALTYLEGHNSDLLVEAHANLRDVLDHLVRAGAPGISPEEMDHHLAEAREHLRRAAVHPLQEEVEDRLAYLEGVEKWYYIRREFFPDVPTERDFRQRKKAAVDLLVRARLLKGDHNKTRECIDLLRQGLDQLDKLADDIKTSRRSLALRLGFAVAVAILAALIGAIVTKYYF